MNVCFYCGKPIRSKKMVVVDSPKYLVKLGISGRKLYHEKCYDAAEREAAKELVGGR